MTRALRNKKSHKSEMRAWMRKKYGDNWSTKKGARAEYDKMKATHSSRRPIRRARKNSMDAAPWVGVKVTRKKEVYRGFKTRRGAENFASGRKKNVFRGPFEIGYGFLGAGRSVEMPREEARRNSLGLQGFGGQKLARWNGPSDTRRLLTLTNWEIRSRLSRGNPFDPETDEPPEWAVMSDAEYREKAKRRYMGATPRRPSEVVVTRAARKAGYKGGLSAVEISLRDRDETSDVGLLRYIETIRAYGKSMGWPRSQTERYRKYALTEASRRSKLKTSRIHRKKGTKTGYALATRSAWGKKGHVRSQKRKSDESLRRFQAEQRRKHIAKLTGYRRDAHDLGIPYVGRKKVDVIADIQDLQKRGRGRSASFPEIERVK